MFKFFKKQDGTAHKMTKSSQSSHVAPGTQIHYIPDLVENLHGDHKVLLDLFSKIK